MRVGSRPPRADHSCLQLTVKPMPDLWYYGRNEQRYGPVPKEELKGLVSSGNLEATDLVWSPGMADWLPASEVDGLFDLRASGVVSPPPAPPATTSPPPPPPETEVPVAWDCWHYERQGECRGPVSFEELRHLAASEEVQPENLVWKVGMPEWLSAAHVEGLFSSPASPSFSPAEVTSPAPLPPQTEAPVAEERWHYECQGKRCGPVLFSELQRLASCGQIQPDSLTWKRGMAEWTPAWQIDGLFPTQQETPGQPAIPSADSWYYGDGEQRCGPVSTEELRELASSGRLHQDSLVWKQGMADWTPAGQIEGVFQFRLEMPVQPPVQSADLWYYGDGEQRHGPVSVEELRELAASGRLHQDSLVWKQGMADWIVAADVKGLFPAADAATTLLVSLASLKSRETPSSPPVPAPTLQEQVQSIREAVAPHLSTAAAVTRTNLERFQKFVHRQHLGTRLRLLVARLARGAVRCYNAARPYVVRAWRKRPSRQEVRDWSAAKTQRASETWKRTAPWRMRFARPMLAGLRRGWKGIAYRWKVRGGEAAWKKAEAARRAAEETDRANAEVGRKAKAEAERRAAEEAARAKAEAERKAAEEKARKAAEKAACAKAEAEWKPEPAATPSRTPVVLASEGPPSQPEPAIMASAVPAPTAEPITSILKAQTRPEPECAGSAARVPPPMPKPARPAARVPPPMPKPVRSAPRLPPPMPKPKSPAALSEAEPKTPPAVPKSEAVSPTPGAGSEEQR